MQKFLHHEPIAAGVFNMGHVTGSSTLEVWEPFLANTAQSLVLLVERMEGDYLALSPKMRKIYRQSDIELGLNYGQFMLRHLDQDLTSCLERTVPPVNLESITAFKISLAKHAKQAGAKLAEQVAAASYIQLQSQIDRDLAVLTEYFDAKQAEADRQAFNEWGRAALQYQLKYLNTTAGNEFFFTAYYREDGAKECGAVKSDVAGTLMSASTSAAVSESKPSIHQRRLYCLHTLPGAVADSLSSETDGGRLRVLKEKLESFNAKYKQVAAGSNSSNPSSAGAAGAGAGAGQAGPTVAPRTLSQPQFSEGDRPIDVGKADGSPSLFRYDVKPKNKISCIEPTVPDGDPQNMRATMLGSRGAWGSNEGCGPEAKVLADLQLDYQRKDCRSDRCELSLT
eukprot:s2636_g14.t1